MRFPRWLFFPVSFALLLVLAIWPISNPLKGLDDEKIEAHAPFWFASPDAGAAILVNNAAPEGFAFRLRLHGPDGVLLHSQEHFADSAASLTIPVSDWLDGSVEAGYAVLEYPAQFGGYLPAQMVVSSPGESVSANYLLLEKGSSSSQRMHWAFWVPSGQSDLYLMLLNRSEAPIDAKIASRFDKGEVGDEVRIAPGSLQRLRLGERLAGGLRAGLAGGISLSHSGSPGDLLAEGFVFDSERGISYTLDRFEFDAPGSANLVYPLVRHGTMQTGRHARTFRPLAVLSNGSAAPMEIQPLIRLEGGQEALLESWVLEPFESRAVDLHRLLRRQLPSLTSFQGPLELSHSGAPGELAATVLSRGPASDRIYQSAVKQDSHLSAGYSYPFRLWEGWNTRIYLSNRSSERVMMCVFLHFDGKNYTWSGGKHLEPFESRSLDIGRLRDEQVPDEFGRLIPMEVESGQAILVVHDEDPSRVAAQAVLENAEDGLAISASCSVCPPSDTKLYLRRNLNDPEGAVASYVGFPGEKERIYAVLRNSLGGEKGVSSFANYSSSDASVAKVKKSFGKAEVEFLQPGLAEEIGAIFSGCWYAPPLGECGSFFEEGECGCNCQSVPLSVPEGGLFGGPNPAAEALVLQPTVSITDIQGVPKNGTKDIQVTIPQGPLNVDITLKLSTTTGSGSARFAANNSTTLKVRQTGPVKIKGITESSTADNVQLQAKLGSSVLDTENFSVVWVTLDPLTSGSISNDNARKANFSDQLGSTAKLGTFQATGPIIKDSWHTGVEIVGTVKPNGYTGVILLKRDRVGIGDCFGDIRIMFSTARTSDTSANSLRDDLPQSGGSMGRVYDLDAPGRGLNTGDLDGTIRRIRQNFEQWAVLDTANGPRVSDTLEWTSRISIRKDGAAIVLHEDVPNDNKAVAIRGFLTCR